MSKRTKKNGYIGGTKRSTDDLINDSIAQQNAWMENRRNFARRFLKSLNIFARPKQTRDTTVVAPVSSHNTTNSDTPREGLGAYWFPILCALVVVFIAIWVAFLHIRMPRSVDVPVVPEPIIQPVARDVSTPLFDIVRIAPDGNVVIAGRAHPDTNVSVMINGKIVSTIRTDKNGEFVYSPTHAMTPGNYTVSLIDGDGKKSADKVFLYISEHGYANSVSLLMTESGSTLLQSPTVLHDGDLNVSKIDYLSTGRIVVMGDGLPRLRVSLALNDDYIGFARVSDHKHFGLGADVGELTPGQEYKLTVRMHDGDGRTVSTITHDFIMPNMTGDDDTFYTVRRGDCLWVIARNFMRRGTLFSIIANRNHIQNPDLIFPKQKLYIPVSKGKNR